MLTDAKVAALKPPVTGQDEHPDTKVTGLRLRVGAGGKKAWIVRRRVGAKVINRKIGNYPAMGLASARKAAETLIGALEREGTTDAIDRTFGAVAEHWIKNVAKVKNASWQHQERQLERLIFPAWRDRKIIDIKRSDVRDLIDGIEGKILPNRILALVKVIFRYALSRDWIEASPADGVAKPADESERDRVLSMGEIERVWRAADLLGYPVRQFIQTLLLTGQRRSEVAGMEWADVDLKAATWALSADDTKASRAHLVPLSAPVVAILDAVPRMGPFVFTTDGETHLKDYGKGKQRLDAFVNAGGDPLEPWTLHDLRRSAATHMVRLGVSVEVVSRVLNHAAAGVTRKVYALHDFAPEKRVALDKWAAEIVRTIEGKSAGKVVKLRAT
jgi:integrase